MHPRLPGMHIAVDNELLILSFELNFLCADMFPYEGSKTVSVCPYPEKRNHPGFVNISPTLVIDTSMERSSRVLHHGNPKNLIFFLKGSKLNLDLCQRAEITLASSISVLH